MIELSDHPYFLGCQFHPEFKSRPLAEAVLKAMTSMQADGSYDRLFSKYGVVPIEALAVAGPTG